MFIRWPFRTRREDSSFPRELKNPLLVCLFRNTIPRNNEEIRASPTFPGVFTCITHLEMPYKKTERFLPKKISLV